MYSYGNQQQQPQQQPQQQQQYGYPNNQYPQQTGYVNNWSTQPQQPQQLQQQTQQLQTQPTGYGFGTANAPQQPQLSSFGSFNPQQPQQQLQSQPITSFQSQPTGGLMQQRTGYQNQPAMTSFQSQPTGGLMQQQRTGYQAQQPMTSFQSQPTGGLMQQRTGYQNQPAMSSFQSQPTGGFVQQPMTSFQSQPTGYQAQPVMNTFQSQPTGGLMQQQRTGYQVQQPMTSFQSQPTGGLMSQATGYANQPLTAQPTGFISTLTNLGTQNNDLTLPNIRLSFISARDQSRFETIFRNNVPKGENSMDGNTARGILMKSQLSAVNLSKIWELADTNKSGSLMFPEFCIALHLANMTRSGQEVPLELPLKIKNEVIGFVDAINFNVGRKDTQTPIMNQATGYANIPLQSQRTGLVPLTAQQTSGLIPIQQNGLLTSQPTGIFAQKTGGLIAQQTGTAPPMTSFMAQQTGGLMPQATTFQPQQTGMMPQNTGYQPQQQFGMMPQATGFQSQPTGGLMSQPTGLQPMPTGKPGQWGFVSMPTGGLPGLDMMQSHFMPNADTQSSLLQNQMGGTTASNVTWAITKQEKMIYDNIFKQWDKGRNGFVNGDVAIGVFTKSGLSFGDLEKIWTLCDQGNKGKLNKDEFAVAMHLIYRRLNSFDIPNILPPELVPPSSKVLENTVDNMKNELKKQAANGGVGSPLNVRNGIPRSGTVYKNNDDSINYVSSARHRTKDSKDDDSSNAFSSKLSIEDLKKKVHEKKILLAAIDAEDSDSSENQLKQKQLNEIEMIKTKIKSCQSQLNSSNSSNIDSIEEKEEFGSKLNSFSDKVPQLVDAISQMDDKIKAAKIEIFRLRLQKENPNGIDIKGSGPNGEITEADKRIAKQKALLQAKMAKLTGKPAPNFAAFEDNESKINDEIIKVTKESEDQKDVIKDISGSITSLITDINDSLNLTNSLSVGHAKWEKKEGVQNQEIADFIDYLNSTKPAHKTAIAKPSSLTNPYLNAKSGSDNKTSNVQNTPSTSSQDKEIPKISSGLSSAEERAKKIKEKAEKRMNERLAKLGIHRKTTPASASASPSTETESPKPNVENELKKQSPTPPVSRPSPPPLPTSSKPTAESFNESESDSDSDENSDSNEYKALLEQKRIWEERERERKEKKKRAKEEKLAKLKAEMAALKKQEEEEEEAQSDDSWDKPNDEVPAAKAKVVEANIPSPVTHTPQSNNPFASMINKAENEKKPESQPSYNPFSKPQQATASSETSNIDLNKLKKQRESQMGKNTNDGWSDSDGNDSEDEMPSATKQAELASMLFGGSGEPSRSTTYIPPAQSTDETATENNNTAASETTEAKDSINSTSELTSISQVSSFPPPAPVYEVSSFPPPVLTSEISSFPPPNSTPTSNAVPVIPDIAPPTPEADSPTNEPSEPAYDVIPPIPLDIAPPLPSTIPPQLPDTAPPGLNDDSLDVPSSRDDGEFYDAKSEESSFLEPTPPSSPESETTVPPIPTTEVPELPTSIPPPPPSLPSAMPPPPPELPTAIPPPPPSLPSFNATATGGAPDINALLGQISTGTALKKVDESEKHISDGAIVGKVID